MLKDLGQMPSGPVTRVVQLALAANVEVAKDRGETYNGKQRWFHLSFFDGVAAFSDVQQGMGGVAYFPRYPRSR